MWYIVEKLLTWTLQFSFYNIISDRQIDSMGDTSPQPTIPKDEGLKKNEAFFQAMEDNVQVAKDPLSLRKPVNLPSVDIIKERANAGNSQVPMVNASKDWTLPHPGRPHTMSKTMRKIPLQGVNFGFGILWCLYAINNVFEVPANPPPPQAVLK